MVESYIMDNSNWFILKNVNIWSAKTQINNFNSEETNKDLADLIFQNFQPMEKQIYL